MAGLFVATKNSQLRTIEEDEISNLLLFALPISVIGARIYYVVFSWDDYKDDLVQIFNLRAGGLAIYGGVIGGVATAFVYSKIKKMNYPLSLSQM